ncbi:hypothetical protein A8M60_04600 [Nocardia farcinica]|nr:hypothetical protein A8M60_04600 [Nocardia farcinica]
MVTAFVQDDLQSPSRCLDVVCAGKYDAEQMVMGGRQVCLIQDDNPVDQDTDFHGSFGPTRLDGH